jgi:hypothetical protein
MAETYDLILKDATVVNQEKASAILASAPAAI